MTEREWESEVIEIDTDITAPGANKKTKHTVTDILIQKPSHEDFVTVWSEAVFDKGLMFDFFSDPLIHKDILVTVNYVIITFSSTEGKDTILPRIVLRKAMMISRQKKVVWDSKTHISEPDRHTKEQGVDESDDHTDCDVSTYIHEYSSTDYKNTGHMCIVSVYKSR